ncbi:methyltransferase domain-containing protein [Alteromonas pelagimontana]|uniref:Methyltransferase domain-containing protein n=1 Tax=Alteromonas pelagimontana TaxID=1858656 RepID=A0A6M4MI08_9ALTE|nr:methyltransferase domain-containing protein [Alteromonas pelagimontana]QJR82558.1 methyltransferase domain-containing protein [Alteromonas pelagimontana]
MWQCPLCHLPLAAETQTWHCANHHSFDVAKVGYVNLHPVQHKNSRQPGDDKSMLQARRAFHDSHGYAPLMEAISLKLAEFAAGKKYLSLFDAGCGEGSYLAYCQQYLQQQQVSVSCAGCDIAKPGIEMAAKRYKNAQFVVANSFALPVQDKTQDAIVQVFAPGDPNEYLRVLKDDGVLITVDPGPKHLWDLKQKVYDTPREHNSHTRSLAGFTLCDTQQVSFVLEFRTPEQRNGLLAMTPFIWKLSANRLEQLQQALDSVTADFVINVWQKGKSTVPGAEE